MESPQLDFNGIELQSQIRNGSKPSVTSRYVSELEEHEVVTSCGIAQRVYTQPSQGKTALITYHDIGTNHTSFLGFFNHPEMRVICQHFKVYHICAPGHHENAPNVCFGGIPKFYTTSTDDDTQNRVLLSDTDINSGHRQSVSTVSRGSSIDGSTTSIIDTLRRKSSMFLYRSSYPDMDQLADMINSILAYFKIKYFVGIGMGAGSNVLARYALRNPDHVHGLFLLNPNATTHGYYQWFMNNWSDLPSLEKGLLSDNLFDQLVHHWFGYGLGENEDLVNFYHQLARSLNTFNLAGYVRSYINRKRINLIRDISVPAPAEVDTITNVDPTVIKTEVFLLTGDRAMDLAQPLAEMNGCMDPKRTQFLTIPDCTGMVMEENPSKLATNFLHFLRSISLVINLTPEKMRQQAYSLQQSNYEAQTEKNNLPNLSFTAEA